MSKNSGLARCCWFGISAVIIGACARQPESIDPHDYEGDDEFECRDRADNDRNGLFDCDDPGCYGSPDCAEATSEGPVSTEGDSTSGAETDVIEGEDTSGQVDTAERATEGEETSEGADTSGRATEGEETDSPRETEPPEGETDTVAPPDTGEPPGRDTDSDSCPVATPVETFGAGDAPRSLAIPDSGHSAVTPWGYDKPENRDRRYPVVVNGCWGEGHFFTEAVRKTYPAFFLEYQQCDSDAQGAALADLMDAALEGGLRIDPNRVYLTGFSKGGSGSYKLIRGFLSRGRLFAGLIRVAGQSESVLADEAVEKTSIWYHIGLQDTAARVQVARDAYEYVKNHALNKTAEESTEADEISGFARTTHTLTKGDIAIMKLSEYDRMGHAPDPVYTDPAVFEWLFSQSLGCR